MTTCLRMALGVAVRRAKTHPASPDHSHRMFITKEAPTRNQCNGHSTPLEIIYLPQFSVCFPTRTIVFGLWHSANARLLATIDARISKSGEYFSPKLHLTQDIAALTMSGKPSSIGNA